MRVHLMLAALLLAGCGATQAPVPDEAAGAPVKTAERVEAEHACADLTGHAAEGPEGAPSATDAKREQEFESCVSTVLKGDDAPALRGRTDAPA